MKKTRIVPHRFKVYDYLHRSAVFVLVSGTVLLCGKLMYDLTYYIKFQRPERMRQYKLRLEEQLAAKQLQEEEQQLLQERLQEKANMFDSSKV